MRSKEIEKRIEKVRNHLRVNIADYQAVISLFRYNDRLANQLRKERQIETFKFIKRHK